MAASAFPFSLSEVMLKRTSATASIGMTTMITKKRRSRRLKLMLALVCTRIVEPQRRSSGVLGVGHTSISPSAPGYLGVVGNGARVGALQMTAFFGGCACLTAAAIAGAFEARLAPALVAAAPWLVGAAVMWAGVVWPDLRGLSRRGPRALAVGAAWVVA